MNLTKWLLLAVALSFAGCRDTTPPPDEAAQLAEIVANAISSERLKWGGKEGEPVCYSPHGPVCYSGWVKYLDPSGQLIGLVQYQDGLAHGQNISWHENGQKKDESVWTEGKANGPACVWNEAGQRIAEINFTAGKKDGLETSWYTSGQKRFEGSFKDDDKDGLWTQWHENGQKRIEGAFKAGKKDGVWTHWNQDGRKTSTTTYKDGRFIKRETEPGKP